MATFAYLQNYVLLSDEKSISNLFEANGIEILLMIASYINDFVIWFHHVQSDFLALHNAWK